MITIQTNNNIVTELTIISSGYVPVRERWDITYKTSERSLIGGNILKSETKTCVLTDTNEIDTFLAVFSTLGELISESEAKALEHSGITEWDGTTIDDIANDPNATDVQIWQPGLLVAPPNVLRYNEINYDVVQPHTTQADWLPDQLPVLYTVSADQGGGATLPDWIQPVGAQDAYALGAQVAHNGLCWESNTPDNVWEPGVFGWDEITCPA